MYDYNPIELKFNLCYSMTMELAPKSNFDPTLLPPPGAEIPSSEVPAEALGPDGLDMEMPEVPPIFPEAAAAGGEGDAEPGYIPAHEDPAYSHLFRPVSPDAPRTVDDPFRMVSDETREDFGIPRVTDDTIEDFGFPLYSEEADYYERVMLDLRYMADKVLEERGSQAVTIEDQLKLDTMYSLGEGEYVLSRAYSRNKDEAIATIQLADGTIMYRHDSYWHGDRAEGSYATFWLEDGTEMRTLKEVYAYTDDRPSWTDPEVADVADIDGMTFGLQAGFLGIKADPELHIEGRIARKPTYELNMRGGRMADKLGKMAYYSKSKEGIPFLPSDFMRMQRERAEAEAAAEAAEDDDDDIPVAA